MHPSSRDRFSSCHDAFAQRCILVKYTVAIPLIWQQKSVLQRRKKGRAMSCLHGNYRESKKRPLLLVLSQIEIERETNAFRSKLTCAIEQMCSNLGTDWLIVPPVIQNSLERLLAQADGILICGTDLTAAEYYGIPSPSIDDIMANLPECDHVAMRMIKYAAGNDLPTLGICHGAQLINIACGGDIRFVEGHCSDGAWNETAHGINIESDFSEFLDIDFFYEHVNSKHSLACGELGEGLACAACGEALEGGTVPEIIWDPVLSFFVGVQWHPEFLPSLDLSQALLSAWRHAMEEHMRAER